MMIRQFQELSSLNKKSVVRHKGVYLLIHKEADVDVVLYQIENFYVEVFFSTGNPMEIRFRAFDNMQELDKYLHLVDIAAIEALVG